MTPVGLAMVAVGGLLVWSAVTGESLPHVFRDVLTGEPALKRTPKPAPGTGTGTPPPPPVSGAGSGYDGGGGRSW